MHEISLTDFELSKRGSQIPQLLSPIRGLRPVPWSTIPSNLKWIFTARDKKMNSSYEEWRFNTFNKNFSATYFEIWLPINPVKPNYWYLEKSYLNIFHIDRKNRIETEYLCIHADPEDNHLLKKSIHLHIKKSEYPIPKAHIALNLNYLEQVFSNKTEFFNNFRIAIQMVSTEIIEKV